MMELEFVGFPKIARLSRECVITEKLDGTNAQVHIRPGTRLDPTGPNFEFGMDTQVEISGEAYFLRAGSRTRWISTRDDNHGFASWVYQHAHELARLGPGAHFGEWWGQGIQRKYGLDEKRWSLFNTHRWSDPTARPACCHVVPVLWEGPFITQAMQMTLDWLAGQGSKAAPGFMQPEGIVIYHTAAKVLFKKTLEKDDEWKGKAA